MLVSCNLLAKEQTMKRLVMSLTLMVSAFSVAACGTIGGTISGAGEDLTKAGNWIKSR